MYLTKKNPYILLGITLFTIAILCASFMYNKKCDKPESSLENNEHGSYRISTFNIDVRAKGSPEFCNSTSNDLFTTRSTSFISDDPIDFTIFCDINCYDGSQIGNNWVDMRYNFSSKRVIPIIDDGEPILTTNDFGVKDIGIYECCSVNHYDKYKIQYKFVHYIHYQHFSDQIDNLETNNSNGDLLFMVDFEYASDDLIWYWVNTRDIQHEAYEITRNGKLLLQCIEGLYLAGKYMRKKDLYLDVYETVTRNNNNTRVRTVLKINPLGHKNSVISFIVQSCLSMSEHTLLRHVLAKP